jgi:hypothetical protein
MIVFRIISMLFYVNLHTKSVRGLRTIYSDSIVVIALVTLLTTGLKRKSTHTQISCVFKLRVLVSPYFLGLMKPNTFILDI